MKSIGFTVVVLAALLTAGCTDATMSQLSSYNEPHRITLYSGGEIMQEWTSTGKVKTEEGSDGYYFRDAATDKLVRVSGDVVITPIGD